MLWKLYPNQIVDFYKKIPKPNGLCFSEEIDFLLDQHYCWQADLARYMISQGIDVSFIVTNAKPTQLKWAKENGLGSLSLFNWEKYIKSFFVLALCIYMCYYMSI